MRIFVIADTHFNHQMLIDKGYRPKGYDQFIWNDLINLPNDCLLIHLGDICIGNDLDVHNKLKRLSYKKVLVKGNHDCKSNHWYLSHGWDFVCEQFQDTYFGKKVLFSHVPVRDSGFDFNIHGHFHVINREDYNIEFASILNYKHKLVSLEGLGYKPILLERLLNNENIYFNKSI